MADTTQARQLSRPAGLDSAGFPLTAEAGRSLGLSARARSINVTCRVVGRAANLGGDGHFSCRRGAFTALRDLGGRRSGQSPLFQPLKPAAAELGSVTGSHLRPAWLCHPGGGAAAGGDRRAEQGRAGRDHRQRAWGLPTPQPLGRPEPPSRGPARR